VRRGGPPRLQFHGGAAKRLHAIQGRSSLLTITHSENLAIAQVIILGE
jgi:phosphopantetheinyl transferase (holo-ACP synthase)